MWRKCYCCYLSMESVCDVWLLYSQLHTKRKRISAKHTHTYTQEYPLFYFIFYSIPYSPKWNSENTHWYDLIRKYVLYGYDEDALRVKYKGKSTLPVNCIHVFLYSSMVKCEKERKSEREKKGSEHKIRYEESSFA